MNVGILLFDEVEVLDFAGPFEAFAITTDQNHQKIFNVFTIAEKEEISARINTRKYQPLQIRPMAMRSFFIFYLFQRKYQS